MSGRVHAEAQAAPKSSFTPVRTGLLAGSCGKPLVSQPPLIQAKLTINQPHDRYEQEAVMRMPTPKSHMVAPPSGQAHTPQIQRACPECGEEEGAIQRKPLASAIIPLIQRQTEEEEEGKKEVVQAKHALNQFPNVTHELPARIKSLRGSSQPLPQSTRAFFEPRFGYDFSQVRVYTDTPSAESARALNARAFTAGRNVVFAAGQYAPETNIGQRLLAHELTHVVQQSSAVTSLADKSILPVDPQYEDEEDNANNEITGGKSVYALSPVRVLETNRLQRHAAVHSVSDHDVPQGVDGAPTSRDRSLHNILEEPSFGHDFSRIRVQSDVEAAQPVPHSCPSALNSPRFYPFGGVSHSYPPRIQAKLTVNEPGDKYEQEADRVAEQVMRMPDPLVQRKGCLIYNDIDDEEQIQTKPIAEQITPLVQRQVDNEKEEEEEEEEEEEMLQTNCTVSDAAKEELPSRIRGKAVQGEAINLTRDNSSKCGCTELPEFSDFYPEVGYICHAKVCAPAVLLDNTHICLSEGDQVKVLEIIHAKTKDESDETWSKLAVMSGAYKGKTILMRDRFVDFCSPEKKEPPLKKAPSCNLPFRVMSDSDCGAGDDFRSADYIKKTVPPEKDKILDRYRSKSETELIKMMKLELGGMAGGPGKRVTDQFINGSGVGYIHGETSNLGKDAKASPSFASIRTDVHLELIKQLISKGKVKACALGIPPKTIKRVDFNHSKGDTIALHAVFGGTQGLLVDIVKLEFSDNNKVADVELKYTICDDFGVDLSDVTDEGIKGLSDGLKAFWILQHEYKTNKPFINKIIVSDSLSVKL